MLNPDLCDPNSSTILTACHHDLVYCVINHYNQHICFSSVFSHVTKKTCINIPTAPTFSRALTFNPAVPSSIPTGPMQPPTLRPCLSLSVGSLMLFPVSHEPFFWAYSRPRLLCVLAVKFGILTTPPPNMIFIDLFLIFLPGIYGSSPISHTSVQTVSGLIAIRPASTPRTATTPAELIVTRPQTICSRDLNPSLLWR